jgi:hypothetical protein
MDEFGSEAGMQRVKISRMMYEFGSEAGMQRVKISSMRRWASGSKYAVTNSRRTERLKARIHRM